MDDNDDKPELGYGVMGGIVGDVLGSIYQFDNYKTIDPKSMDLINPSCDYSDDSVMTVATMAALNTWVPFDTYPFAENYRRFGRHYHRPPGGGYGRQFAQWLKYDRLGPY